MNVELYVDRTACIACGRCVKICPAGIFSLDVERRNATTANVSSCIVCGHCVAACPTGAVHHGDFPPSRVHDVDRSELPSPEEVLTLCRMRRSNRAFDGRPVPEDKLAVIVEAAHRAPTASNKQQVAFTVVTDPAALRRVTDYTMKSFRGVLTLLRNPVVGALVKAVKPDIYAMLPMLERLDGKYKAGVDPILRGASALLLIHTPADNRFGRDDANLAYQNGSLMAESLGVSQFYTGFLCTAIRRDRRGEFSRMLGIDGVVHAGMALGMPAFRLSKYIDKKDVCVEYIRQA